MPMQKMGKPAESPTAYVAALTGWRKTLVASLRRATRAAGKLAPAQVSKLVKAAMALNRKLGDPREAAGTR
jgi:hypothetical protein